MGADFDSITTIHRQPVGADVLGSPFMRSRVGCGSCLFWRVVVGADPYRVSASLFVNASLDSRGEAAVLKFAQTSRQHRRKVWEFQEPFLKGSWG